MTTSQLRAHGISLPLFAMMQRLEDAPLEQFATSLQQGISQLLLDDHLRLVLLLKDGGMGVDLQPKSDFGREVLKELTSRSVVTPCPPGECDYKNDSCLWCGEPKKA